MSRIYGGINLESFWGRFRDCLRGFSLIGDFFLISSCHSVIDSELAVIVDPILTTGRWYFFTHFLAVFIFTSQNLDIDFQPVRIGIILFPLKFIGLGFVFSSPV